MKTHLHYFAITCCLFGTIPLLYSQGYLVPNGVTYAGYSPFTGAEIHVLQNPTNGNYTGFSLPPQGGNIFLFNPIVDEGVRTFLVSPNDPISLQPIQANSYPELTFPNTYFFANGATFYLGFYTGPRWILPETDPHTYEDPLFGWAKFVNKQGVIQLLDSALEYKGGGIFAGTQTIIPIPEPSGLTLGLLGAFLLACRRWLTSSRVTKSAP